MLAIYYCNYCTVAIAQNFPNILINFFSVPAYIIAVLHRLSRKFHLCTSFVFMDHYAECFVPLGEEDAAFFEDNNYTDSDINNDPTVRKSCYNIRMCG